MRGLLSFFLLHCLTPFLFMCILWICLPALIRWLVLLQLPVLSLIFFLTYLFSFPPLLFTFIFVSSQCTDAPLVDLLPLQVVLLLLSHFHSSSVI